MRRAVDLFAVVSLLAVVSWQHWDVLCGDRHPVGGDKTAFFYGLMCHYDRCLEIQRLPFWNELWGFGFPGLAESQVGALYPPHLLLYGLLTPFAAFRWTFLLHRLALVVVGFISFRTMGLRSAGAWLATLVFVTGGFAIGHLDHQWAVEAMLWLPAILACFHLWFLFHSRKALLLAPLLLMCQLFIGHFQIAFMTLVVGSVYALFSRLGTGRRSWLNGLAGFIAVVVVGMSLAGAQLFPTAALARYIRTVNPQSTKSEYLSTHATPPWLATQYFFPCVYFREPLWRDVFWTPLRTAPEECLAYVGLVPLCLALGGAWRWRRNRSVRLWTLIAFVGMVLSWGPFVPWFDWLVSLPGFSFFRCAGRWGIVVQWSLGLLAGWSLDRMRSPVRLASWWWRLLPVIGIAAGMLVGWWWLIDSHARHTGSAPMWLNHLLEWIVPFASDRTADEIVREMGTRKLFDAYTQRYWLALDRPPRPQRLIDLWADVWRYEVLPSVALIGVCSILLLLVSHACPRKRNALLIVAGGLCVADMMLFSSIFPDRTASVSALRPDGPFFEAMEELPRGSRVIAPGGNLLQGWNLAPIPSYRTLDIPLPQPLSVALSNPGRIRWQDPPHSIVGLQAIVEHLVPPAQLSSAHRAYPSEQLEWWLSGNIKLLELVEERGQMLSTAVRQVTGSDGWPAVIPQRLLLEDEKANRHGIYGIGISEWQTFPQAQRAEAPSHWKVRTQEPAIMVFGQLYLPGWSARIGSNGTWSTVEGCSIDGYWLGIPLPADGEYDVQLQYQPPGWRAGLWLSAAAFLVYLVWIGCVLRRVK